MKRHALCIFAVLCAAATANAAERWPDKPIRIVIASAPSSGPDIVARLLGAAYTQRWGQQVIADNRPGAAGNVGAEFAARAAPDGYVLFIANSQQVTSIAMNERTGHDLVRDFAPITLIAAAPYVLVVHPVVPATSVGELIALARARPRVLNYGSSGVGGAPHLAAAMLAARAGIDIVHVPYKSVVFALTDVMGGQIELAFSVLPAAQPAIRQGRLRALGVSTPKRTRLAPELAPIAETVPGFELVGWLGVAAPAGTPGPVIAAVDAVTRAALATAELRDRLQAAGFEVIGAPPAEFAAFIETQIAKMRAAVESSIRRK